MHAHSDYEIRIKGTKEEKNAVAEILGDTFKDDWHNSVNKEEFVDSGLLIIKDTYEVVFLEDITGMAIKMAKAAPGSSFSIKGVVDTSESAGEYMDIEITYSDSELTEKSSDWYMYPISEAEEMSYEEYCEEWGEEYSEEDYEKMRQGWFIVETRPEFTMMQTVPLSNVEIKKVD